MTATARPIVAALTNNLTDEAAPLSPLDAEEREIARLRAEHYAGVDRLIAEAERVVTERGTIEAHLAPAQRVLQRLGQELAATQAERATLARKQEDNALLGSLGLETEPGLDQRLATLDQALATQGSQVQGLQDKVQGLQQQIAALHAREAELRAQAQARPVALDERDRAYRVARAREALRAYLTAIEACAAWNGQQGYGAGGQGVDVYNQRQMIEARERGLLPPIRGSEGIAFSGADRRGAGPARPGVGAGGVRL